VAAAEEPAAAALASEETTEGCGMPGFLKDVIRNSSFLQEMFFPTVVVRNPIIF